MGGPLSDLEQSQITRLGSPLGLCDYTRTVESRSTEQWGGKTKGHSVQGLQGRLCKRRHKGPGEAGALEERSGQPVWEFGGSLQ